MKILQIPLIVFAVFACAWSEPYDFSQFGSQGNYAQVELSSMNVEVGQKVVGQCMPRFKKNNASEYKVEIFRIDTATKDRIAIGPKFELTFNHSLFKTVDYPFDQQSVDFLCEISENGKLISKQVFSIHVNRNPDLESARTNNQNKGCIMHCIGMHWLWNTSPSSRYSRYNLYCYDPQEVCDGKSDCPDGEDEANCQCDPALRICGANSQGEPPNKKHYNVHWECDGENDCGNNYDEEDCSPHRQVAHCPGGNQTMFKCNSGKVIPLAFVCDSSEDCDQAEDETFCTKEKLSTKLIDLDGNDEHKKVLFVSLNDPLELQCVSTGNPPPRIVWRKTGRCLLGQNDGQSQTPYKNDQPINVHWNVNSQASCPSNETPKVRSTLAIESVTPEDAGIYSCEAHSGSYTETTSEIHVIVRTHNHQ